MRIARAKARVPSGVRQALRRASLAVYRRLGWNPPTVTLSSAEFVIKPQVRRQRASVRRHRVRRTRIVLGFLIAFGFVLSGAIGALAYFMPAIVTAFQDTGHAIDRNLPTATASAIASLGASPSATATAQSVPPPPGAPFTVLLLGSDNDAKFGGTVLTQSMILARVNPTTKQVVMESIPRDMWVPLSTGGSAKIDAAYEHGGASAAVATVEADFDIHIDHYAWIGLLGLVNLINQVGGIDVVATNPVMDDFYPADLSGKNPYAYERVAVLPGPQHMDGMEALMYVRSRHGDLRSDFGRSQRQQQVLLALRAKAKLLGIANLPDIATAMGNDFSTDMTISEIASLLPIASNIQLQNVKQVILASPYTSTGVLDNEDVLLPNWNLILPETHQYFPAV
jgi:LCP family protein required for cell wall assembly